MDIMETIKDQIESNRVILYMKGSPNQPQCGFSARTVQALMGCGQKFAYVDVLSNPEIEQIYPPMVTGPHSPNCGWTVSSSAAAISFAIWMQRAS